MKRLLAAATVAAIFFATVPDHARAMDRAHFLELNKKGRELAKQKDWKGLRAILTEIGKELPSPTPNYLLRVASVEAHLGHNAEALQWMQRYADMGLSYDVASDDDLKPLLNEPGWSKIAAQMKNRALPVMHTQEVCRLSVTDLMPEDITFHRASGEFIVSSIRRHSLFRFKLPSGDSKECMLTELPLENEAKRWPVLAVSADTRTSAVWMTQAAMPGFNGFPKDDEGKTALLAVDPVSGKIQHKLNLESKGPVMLGDMSVSQDGTVFVSDGRGGGVFRVRDGGQSGEIEGIADGFFSPQTPVLAGDHQRVFVPDYSIGVAVLSPSAHGEKAKVTYLEHPANITLTGLDGLLLSGDSLIGIQNGTDPERIMRFRLNRKQTRVLSAEVIEQSTARMGEPTHAVATGGWIYVIANVGWNKVDDHGELKEGQKFDAPVLLRFREKRSYTRSLHRHS